MSLSALFCRQSERLPFEDEEGAPRFFFRFRFSAATFQSKFFFPFRPSFSSKKQRPCASLFHFRRTQNVPCFRFQGKGSTLLLKKVVAAGEEEEGDDSDDELDGAVVAVVDAAAAAAGAAAACCRSCFCSGCCCFTARANAPSVALRA